MDLSAFSMKNGYLEGFLFGWHVMQTRSMDGLSMSRCSWADIQWKQPFCCGCSGAQLIGTASLMVTFL
jgi:hypothetical protein